MTVLAFGTRLSATAWAREVAKLELDAHAKVHSPNANFREVEFDLSYARSADLLVLGRLLVMIQGLRSTGAKIVVRMPSKILLKAEQGYLAENNKDLDAAAKEDAQRQITRHQLQRINCRLFIEQSGFDLALKEGPFDERQIRVIEGEADRSRPVVAAGPGVEWDQHDTPLIPQRRRRIIPYRWINLGDRPSAKDKDEIGSLYRSIIGLGISSDDAAVLARGVLAEVIENSKVHAGFPRTSDTWVLVGGELTQPKSYSRRVDDFDLYMRDFIVWASDETSPLLRLFIGDAGIGIQDPILAAVDHHATSENVDSLPRGLWKAARIIRSFQGALLVTSRSAIAGYIFDNTPEGRRLEFPSPAWLHGTVVECTVLTAPGRAIRPFEEELSSPIPLSASSAASLSCLTVVLRPRIGLDFQEMSAIQEQLDRLQHVLDGGLVIGVEMPSGIGSMADTGIEAAIGAVLDTISETVNPSTITLVFSGVSRILLGIAIDAINRKHDAESVTALPRLRSSILVVSPENTHYWVGGTPLIRQLLSILSQSSEGKLGIFQIEKSLNAGEDTVFEREIRDQPRLLQLDEGIVALKLRPQDAVDALAAHFSERISFAVRQGEALGVRKGSYLTTSLRVAGRWVDVRLLLRHLDLYQMAGFLLANAVTSRVGSTARSARPSVIRVGSIGEEIASMFSLALTGVPETFDSVAALRMPTGLPIVGTDQPMIICTDVMSRGAYVRRAVRQLWNMGFTQVSVAAIIDGRELADTGESPDFILVRGVEVPVTSLARVSMDLDPKDSTKSPLPIDPVTGTPLPIRYPQSKTVGDQKEYIEAVKESGAARLGHIYRPGQRHYTAYISPSILFQREPWAAKALKRIVRFIEDDNKLISNADEEAAVAVIYAADAKDDFADVVDALVDAINKARIYCLDPIAIPRTPTGGEWAFPRFVQLPPEVNHVVVVDATTKAGRTLRELIRLASAPSIKFISCFGLIHGMPDLDAMSLQQIRQVATYSLKDPSSLRQQTVPVEVRYLVRTAVSSEDAGKCPVCTLRRTYVTLPSTLPRSMSDHRLRLEEVLEPHTRESLFRELETDLFGVHITQIDCVEYLLWRSYLEEARFSTANRQTLVDRLHRLSDVISAGDAPEKAIRKRDALIRLMAAEHNRLEQAPMWFTSVRAGLVKIARSLLAAPTSGASDQMLQVQALVVIARADVSSFCAQYAEIVRMCKQHHEAVLTHAFLEALALLTQDWSNAKWRATLAEQISMLIAEVEAEQPGESSWPFRPMEELSYLASIATRGTRLVPNSKQQAWSELRRFCDAVKGHRYDQAMWRLQRRLEYNRPDMPIASRESAVKDWHQCRAAIDEEVLPNLAMLRGALSSDELVGRRLVSAGERQKWRDIVDGAGPEKLDEVTVAVGRIFLGSEPHATPADELDDVSSELSIWSSFFFQPMAAGDNPAGGSILCDVVEKCPTDLLQSLKDVFDGSIWDLRLHGIRDGETVLIFCSSSILIDALTHLQMNAEVTHREGGRTPEYRIEVSAVGSEAIQVDILNSASSRATRGGGRGLRSVAELLANFDARLEPIEQVPSDWTYGVRLVFQPWKWRL